MLFNPKWGKTGKAPERSLAGFIAWLETQTPEQRYEFPSPRRCVLAEYLGDFCSATAEDQIIGSAIGIVGDHPRTYGAALDRARASLSSQQRGNEK